MVCHALIDLLGCSFFSDLNESVWRDKSSHFSFFWPPLFLASNVVIASVFFILSLTNNNMFAPKLFAVVSSKKRGAWESELANKLNEDNCLLLDVCRLSPAYLLLPSLLWLGLLSAD